MPWNTSIENEYNNLLSGVIGQATDLPGFLLFPCVKPQLIELETGSAGNLTVSPSHDSYLTTYERLMLFCMRLACALFVERNRFFPWRLTDLSVAELRPLVSYHYQGLHESESGRHYFHHVWDVEPGPRMVEAVFGYFLAVIFGADVPVTGREMVLHMIQWMRDTGWVHMLGYYEEYQGYHDHGGYVYDFTVCTEVKRSGCHLMADYLQAALRHYNVPAHYGQGWAGTQPTGNAYWNNLHPHGHCFINFTAEDWWLSHADDVYNNLWKTVPPDFAMMSTYWMEDNQFGESEYTWLRACAFESHFWWCFLIGRSSSSYYDVPTLYLNGALRARLENIHVSYNLASRDGAPAVVPPVFDADMVDALMAWVAAKVD
ncbi:MAG TPA: hypothetical protein ENN69_08790 [Spirochaetia bacterium]|nr:hypothetical protein [Spirochaetia bacterium]